MNDQFFILDIETSGLSNKYSIVEVGIALLDMRYEMVIPYFHCICQESDKFLDPNAWIFKNSSLSFSFCKDAVDLDDFREHLQKIFDMGIPVIAYNWAFDYGFLRDRGFKINNPPFDPMIVLTNIIKISHVYYGFKFPKVTEAFDFLFPMLEYKEKHRALFDAIDEGYIVREVLKRKYIDLEVID